MVRPGEKAAPYGEKSIMSTSDNQQASPAPHGQPDLVAVAEEVIAQAAAGDFDSAVRPFAGAMREQFPADKLAQLWVSLTAQAGAFQGIQGSKQARLLQYETVVTVAAFERGHITFQTIFDDQGHVAGWQVHPDESVSPPAPYEAPSYVRPGSFHEQEVQVGSGKWVLPGTLTLPEGQGPFPAVVLVHGSGQHDRDETIGPNKPFRDISWGLASRGIAILRYDKRTKVYPQQMAALQNITVRDEVTDDALAAVALLRTTPDIDPGHIFVLGHSLGAMLAPRIGEADPQIAGLIILAGLTRPLEDTILDQFTHIFSLSGSISEDQQRQLDVLKAQTVHIKDPSLSPDTPSDQLLGVPASYWSDLRGYYPPATARGLHMPILVLQAERDYQVTMEDYQGWKGALGDRPDVTFKLYPGLIHLFMPGEGKPEDYNVPGHVVPEVVDDIARWVEEESR
jgi:dienelactone hydrolase